MSDQKTFKINAPIGNLVIPKEIMNEKELRDYALQIIQDDEESAPWREKIEKDDVTEVVDWLKRAGFTVEAQ